MADEEEKTDEHMSEDELRAEIEKHFREQKVDEVLVQVMVTLSNLAYIKMGLTEETAALKDMSQASLAIDAFKAVLDSCGTRLPKQDAEALAGALSSMQMTFARMKTTDAGEQEEPEGDDPASRLWVPGKD